MIIIVIRVTIFALLEDGDLTIVIADFSYYIRATIAWVVQNYAIPANLAFQK